MSKMAKPMKFCPCRECEVGVAVEAERERIIEILNKHTLDVDEDALCSCLGCDFTRELDDDFSKHLVAAIKGENKDKDAK